MLKINTKSNHFSLLPVHHPDPSEYHFLVYSSSLPMGLPTSALNFLSSPSKSILKRVKSCHSFVQNSQWFLVPLRGKNPNAYRSYQALQNPTPSSGLGSMTPSPIPLPPDKRVYSNTTCKTSLQAICTSWSLCKTHSSPRYLQGSIPQILYQMPSFQGGLLCLPLSKVAITTPPSNSHLLPISLPRCFTSLFFPSTYCYLM